MTKRRAKHLATRIVHAGRAIEPVTGAVVPPIHMSTTFARDADGTLLGGFQYSRSDNPNRSQLETCLADLESGAAAACFASGSAALSVLLQSLCPGDRILYSNDLYYGSRLLLEALGSRMSLVLQPVELRDLQLLEQELQEPAALIFFETPSNPLLGVIDIEAVALQARRVGALVAVDNTWATPLLQNPLELGADLVLHSTTKYLSGHSDVTGGALITRDNRLGLWNDVVSLQRLAGAVPSPFDCWLTLRGIATLAVRMRAQVETATELAGWLEVHPSVRMVYYPGLPGHQGFQVAQRQMEGFGAMISFQVRGGEGGAASFMSALGLIVRATSLGGVHTLAEHRCRVEDENSTTPRDLIRLSVGIENVEDLRQDLAQALDPTGGEA